MRFFSEKGKQVARSSPKRSSSLARLCFCARASSLPKTLYFLFFQFFPLRPQVGYLDPGLSGRSPRLQQALGHPPSVEKHRARPSLSPPHRPLFAPPLPTLPLPRWPTVNSPRSTGRPTNSTRATSPSPTAAEEQATSLSLRATEEERQVRHPSLLRLPSFSLGPRRVGGLSSDHRRGSNVSTACRSSVRGHSDECTSGPRFEGRSADVGWQKECGRGGRRVGQGSSRLRVLSAQTDPPSPRVFFLSRHERLRLRSSPEEKAQQVALDRHPHPSHYHPRRRPGRSARLARSQQQRRCHTERSCVGRQVVVEVGQRDCYGPWIGSCQLGSGQGRRSTRRRDRHVPPPRLPHHRTFPSFGRVRRHDHTLNQTGLNPDRLVPLRQPYRVRSIEPHLAFRP